MNTSVDNEKGRRYLAKNELSISVSMVAQPKEQKEGRYMQSDEDWVGRLISHFSKDKQQSPFGPHDCIELMAKES